MPGVPEGSSREQHEALMSASEGKPWVSLQYHKAWENDMVMNMIRGLIVNIVIVFLFCWIVSKMNMPSFGTIFWSALAMGMIVFFNSAYTGFIWYEFFDIWAFFLDAIVTWGLTGLWLAWCLRRGTPASVAIRSERTAEMVR